MVSFSKTRVAAVACGVAVTAIAVPQALASGEGTNARLGVRNPSSGNLSVQTQIIASNNNWGTRQSNKGTGGGAIYGCRSAPSANACVRAVNLTNGLAFSFQANSGNTVGLFQVGTTGAVNPNAVPFTTNASAMVTNLNANLLGGLTAGQIESQAVSTANTAAQALSSIAVVGSNGALLNGRGATGSTQTAPGVYNVTFGASIANCALQATVNSAAAAMATAVLAAPTTATVHTFSGAAAADSLPFSLTANC